MKMPEVLDEVRSSIEAKRVYADPVHEDGVTVVPAASVRGGGGGGTDEEGQSGGGFGLAGSPTGAWVVKEGEVTWKPAIDATKVLVLGELTAIVGLLAWRSVRVAQTRKVITIRRPHRAIRLVRLASLARIARRDRLSLPWQEKPKPKFSLRATLPF
jgi:uncharacterized spore protein YtfJ